MRLFTWVIVIFFFCVTGKTFAQTKIIDSLKKKIALATSKDEKIKSLLSLCEQKYSLSANLLHQYATELKMLSLNEPDGRVAMLADYYISYSDVTNNKEDSTISTVNYYLEKLKNTKTAKDIYMLFLQLKGTIFYRTNKSKETINTYYDLLNIAQQYNDTLFILIAKRGISLAYIVDGQDAEGVKIFHSAMQMITPNVPDKFKEIYGLLQINASISYLHLHQASRHMLYADSCEYYGNVAIETGRSSENLFMLCQGLVVKGVIQSYKNNMAEAEKNLKDGLEVRKMIGDTVYIISDMSVLASFYANTKQIEKGVAISKLGIEMAKNTKLTPGLLLPLYQALAENYKVGNQYKEYAETLKLLIDVKDSLNLKSSTDELKNLEREFNLQKQKSTIIQQKLDITKKNYWLYGSALFTVMAGAILWMAFRSYRRKQSNKLKLALDEEKRMALQQIKDAEEQERKRIAADLHDNLGVFAASLSSNLNYLQLGLADSRVEEAMLELKNNSNAIISELNDTIWVLKKDALSLTAVSDRIKIFISRIQKSYPDIGIEVRELIKSDLLMPASQAFHLYRIVQEAVNNCLRHSKCSNIIIEIISNSHWKVIIEDDGVGFSEDKQTSGSGNGLTNMKWRCEEAGWVVKWKSKLTKGTLVEVYGTTN